MICWYLWERHDEINEILTGICWYLCEAWHYSLSGIGWLSCLYFIDICVRYDKNIIYYVGFIDMCARHGKK